MDVFRWFPDALGLLWGLAGGFFNCWIAGKLLCGNMSNKRILALVLIKPVVHLVVLVSAMFISAWFMLLAAAGDLLTLGILFVKNYLEGRR